MKKIITLLLIPALLTVISASPMPDYKGIALGEKKAEVIEKIKKSFPDYSYRVIKKSGNKGSYISIEIPFSSMAAGERTLEFHFELNGILEKISIPLYITPDEYKKLVEHISRKYNAPCITKYAAVNFWELPDAKISLTKQSFNRLDRLTYSLIKKPANISDF